MLNRVWRGVAALTLIIAAACGGGDESGPAGSIAVSASPTSATIPQGGSGTITVTLTRGGGFADPVNVTVEGLPSGVTASVSPTSLTGTTTSATVTVNVANTVAAGTYNATIRASAAGVGAATAQYALTVTALPNYTLSSTPATVSIGQGSSGTATIAINRTNFTDAVALTLVSPPAGITGTFNPASATGNSSTLTINVAGTVATGNYNLTVQGAATGQANKTTTVAVTVTPPPDYTISTTPATLTIAAGQNSTTTVNITRSNFTGAVNLSLVNPPAGVTATFNPAAPTGNTSTATINVATTVVPGNYNITIQGLATSPDLEGEDVAAALTDPKTTTVALTVTTAAAFTLSASPNALTIAAGSSGTSTASIVRTNFTTDVALSLVSPPTGITGTFAPATLTGTTLSSTLTVNVAGTVAAGSYPLTVRGVGGALTQNTTVTVTVPAPNVSFSATPASLSIQQGGSSTTTLNITRSGFTGNITPTVTGNPAGMTVTFNPAAPISGNSSTVTVNVGASTATGTHNVVIAAAGVPGNPSVTVPVTVTQSGGGGGNIVWEFCNNEVPLKFWAKSNGTWSEVTGTVVGAVTRFAFNASGNDAGVAFTSGTSPSFFTFVFLANSSELGSAPRTCATGSAPVTKTFNVSGMQPTETGQLGYGPGSAALSPGTPSYNVQVPAGSYDWMAAFGSSSGFPIPSTTFTHYAIGRNEAAPGAAVNINRANATAFVTAPFTVNGGAGGSFYQFIQGFQGARGSIASIPLNVFGTTPSGNMLFLATADRQSTDLVQFSVNNTDGAGGSVTNLRSQTQWFGPNPPGSATFDLPTAVPAFTVTQPSGNWTAAGSTPAQYQSSTSTVTSSFQGSGGNIIYSISATRNWLVAASMSVNYTLAQQALPNFLPAWQPGAPLTSTTVTMTGSNITTGTVAGSVLNSASRVQMP